MEKEFVPYEQALALKELGFDEPCLSFYTYEGKFSNELSFNEYKNTALKTSAPLYQQAFRWFREKHELIACPMFNRKVGYRFEISINGGDSSCSTKFYGSLEEVQLECLKKLIEIVKINNL